MIPVFRPIKAALKLKREKRTNKKLREKIEEIEANNEFLFNENQILKAKLRGDK